jgi:hypothetical protein
MAGQVKSDKDRRPPLHRPQLRLIRGGEDA